MEVVHIRTSGLDSQKSSIKVKRSVEQLSGVGDVLTLRTPGLTSVMFDPRVVDEDTIAEAIRSAGFGAEVMTPEQTRVRWRELSRTPGPAREHAHSH